MTFFGLDRNRARLDRTLVAHPELVDLGHFKEAHAIDMHIELAESRDRLERWSSVGHDLANVPSDDKGRLEAVLSHLSLAVVDFISIHQHLLLSRGERPDKEKLMFTSTALGSFQALGKSGFVGKSKSETDLALGSSDALTSLFVRPVDLVEGHVVGSRVIDGHGD